jgi:hypothetical protein
MNRWFQFSAYNSQSHYGFGTETEACAYCDILNRKLWCNLYAYREMEDCETGSLDSGDDTDGFRLDETIVAHDKMENAP